MREKSDLFPAGRDACGRGEIIAKVPADADTCYVRVGQNLIWWVCPVGINGAVDIWD